MKRVSIVHGPYDTADVEYETSIGYVVAGNIGMYIQEGTVLAVRVTKTQRENVVVAKGNTITVGETTRGDIAISEVYEMLAGMTGFDFFARYIVASDQDADFNLTK
ncbi:MAG: hypothetical protein K6T85_14520 [Gorillibacterium sp.]|nr:hypothetical protein [Gorillibacterium sp.]